MIRSPARHVALAYACLAAAAVPSAAHACSLATFPVFAGAAAMIATATADTLPAGTGGVRHEVDTRRSGGGARDVYGQVVRVERLGSVAAAALPAGTERVVLVPWDLSPDCRTLLWTTSARWMDPGKRGLFHGALRDRADWVDGVPTLDVFQPWTQPYPDDVILRHQRGPLLTAEEALELMETLPTDEEHRAGGEQAWARLREWTRAHPCLACRHPATEVLLMAQDIGGVPRVPCAQDGEEAGQGGTAARAGGAEAQPFNRWPGEGRALASGREHPFAARFTKPD